VTTVHYQKDVLAAFGQPWRLHKPVFSNYFVAVMARGSPPNGALAIVVIPVSELSKYSFDQTFGQKMNISCSEIEPI